MDASLVHLVPPPCTTKQSAPARSPPPLRPATCVVVTRESRVRFAERARANEQVNHSACNTVSTSHTTLARVVRKAETWSYAAQQEGQLCNKGARANNIGTQAGSALTCSLLHKTQRQANHTNKKAMTSISLLPYNGGERFNTLYAGCA